MKALVHEGVPGAGVGEAWVRGSWIVPPGPALTEAPEGYRPFDARHDGGARVRVPPYPTA